MSFVVSPYSSSIIILLFSVFFAAIWSMLIVLFSSVYFLFSNIFIQKYFADSHQNPLLKALPSRFVSALLLLSFVITSVSENVFCCGSGWLYKIFHITVGGVCLLTVFAAIFLTETDFIMFLKEQWTGKLIKKKDE